MYLSLALACAAPLHLLDGPCELLFLWFVLIALPRTQWLTRHTCGGLWHGHTYNHINCTPGEDTHTCTPYTLHLPHKFKPDDAFLQYITLVCGQLSMWVWDRSHSQTVHGHKKWKGVTNGARYNCGPQFTTSHCCGCPTCEMGLASLTLTSASMDKMLRTKLTKHPVPQYHASI